jgi:hypothetical protein
MLPQLLPFNIIFDEKPIEEVWIIPICFDMFKL